MQKIIITLILLLLVICSQAKDLPIEKKIYTKTFQTQSDVHAEVYTNYGNITYTIGTSNQVQYTAEVIVEGNNSSDVLKKLNSISIEFSQNGNTVVARSQYKNVQVKRVNTKINYTIAVPANAQIAIGSNYTNIYLPTVQNSVEIACNYTDIFCDTSIQDFKFRGNYCDFKTASSFNTCNIKGNYNDFSFNHVSTLNYSGNYNDIKIAHLNTSANITGNYTDFMVQNMNASKVNIEVSGNYLDIIVNCNSDMWADVKGNYTDIKYDSHFQEKYYKEKHNQLDCQLYNSAQATSKIQVNGNYNDVVLK